MSARIWNTRHLFAERWHRYRQTAGPDQWDTDSAITHAANRNDRTACGVYVGKRTEEGGPWEKAWPDAAVTCKRCQRALASQY